MSRLDYAAARRRELARDSDILRRAQAGRRRRQPHRHPAPAQAAVKRLAGQILLRRSRQTGQPYIAVHIRGQPELLCFDLDGLKEHGIAALHPSRPRTPNFGRSNGHERVARSGIPGPETFPLPGSPDRGVSRPAPAETEEAQDKTAEA